jgi:hypothetical protein
LAVGGQPKHRLHPLISVEHRGSVGTAVGIDPDQEHPYLVIVVVACHGGQT